MEATARPWKIKYMDEYDVRDLLGHTLPEDKMPHLAGEITSKDGCICEMISALDWYETEANAELIVKAVNSHDKLVEACKDTLDIIIAYQHIPAQFKACEILQQAIKQAEGK